MRCKSIINLKSIKFSTILSSLILINSSYCTQASMFSEDGRYEIFQGSRVDIPNILEEQKITPIIGGKSVLNMIDYDKNYILPTTMWTHDRENGSIALNQPNVASQGINYKLTKDLELNKEYTLYMNIIKNTMQNDASENVFKVALSKDWGDNNILFIKEGQIGEVKYVFRPDEIVVDPYITCLTGAYGEFEFEDFMILEGNHINEGISFFEGIKSVGETINSDNGFNIYSYENKEISISLGSIYGADGEEYNDRDDRVRTNFLEVNGTAIDILGLKNNEDNIVFCYDINKNYIGQTEYWHKGRTNIKLKDGTKFIRVIFRMADGVKLYVKDYQDIEIYERQYSENIKLKEPLRSVPGYRSDRIVQKNGQWLIERNIGEIILNGSEKWDYPTQVDPVSNYTQYYTDCLSKKMLKHKNVYSDRFIYGPSGYNYANESIMNSWNSGNLHIRILKSKLSVDSVDGFKNYLSENPVTVLYQLNNPYYEPLNCNIQMEILPSRISISADSLIAPNLKITVDRVANRAIEAYELALANPTSVNISQARMWSNLMKDTSLKDIIQSDIDDISDIEDIVVEKKKVSANLDVYIKSENSLVMGISTNSVMFDNFSGVDDMEKKKAVDITVNSSLPYDLNAYLESDAYNSDKSKTLDRKIINLKLNDSADYQNFISDDKITLKQSSPEGINNIHSVDMMLKGNIMHEKDVYRAVIKFEAEQK